MKKVKVWTTGLLLLIFLFTACNSTPKINQEITTTQTDPSNFRIEATWPVKLLEEAGIFETFTQQTGIKVSLSYLGDVELLNRVLSYSSTAPTHVDSMWLGSAVYSPGTLLQAKTSIMRTYIVLAINPNLASQLGWELGRTVTTTDVINAIELGKLHLAAPSASQDDAGANFLFAAISSFVGKPYITSQDLQNDQLQTQLRSLYESVTGSANNAQALSNQFILDQDSGSPKFNGYILPESLAIKTNLELAEKNLTPMQIVYIEDAVGVQDFPLGWIKGIGEEKQLQFDKLVEYLRSESVQNTIQAKGYFRIGSVGMEITNPDPNIFRSEWGIITNRNFLPAILPKDPVILEALGLYQMLFKKPSQTAFCLDYSPSMEGNGDVQRNNAMYIILNQTQASKYLLQMGLSDNTIFLRFSGSVHSVTKVTGNDPTALANMYQWLIEQRHGSATNIYGCVIQALGEIVRSGRTDTLSSVILLTDGQHNTGESRNDLQNYYRSNNLSIPIYSIAMGSASLDDLTWIAQLSNGRVCDGTAGEQALVQCFKDFRGSN